MVFFEEMRFCCVNKQCPQLVPKITTQDEQAGQQQQVAPLFPITAAAMIPSTSEPPSNTPESVVTYNPIDATSGTPMAGSTILRPNRKAPSFNRQPAAVTSACVTSATTIFPLIAGVP